MTKKSSAGSFIHLHVHSDYSLLESTCRIERLVELAGKHRMASVALTDSGVMFGVPEFQAEANRRGINPIIGCELGEMSGRVPGTRLNLVLLAANNDGYRNLCRLVSSIHIERRHDPRGILDLLARHHRGLIGLGAVRRENESLLAAIQAVSEYADIFGRNNFYLELQDHGLPAERREIAGMREIAGRTGLPLVATNDVRYPEKRDADAHAVLGRIRIGAPTGHARRARLASPEFYFKSAEEMLALFRELPAALENTVEIAARCKVAFDFKEKHIPLKVPHGETPKSYLLKLCRAGLRERYGIVNPDRPPDEPARQILARLHYEAGIIENLGVTANFLLVWDLVRFAREQRIPVGPGRGAAPGSLVCYALGITDIDPICYGLVFERFLNPERMRPPDFAIDFCQARRGEVLEYAREKYGRENVAQIVTFGTLGAKTAIRDVGRALRAPPSVCDRLVKLVPAALAITLETALRLSPALEKMSGNNPQAKRIMKDALSLQGLKRHTGLHAAGLVIGDRPLAKLLPLARDKSGAIVTQYGAEHVEALGLFKADFLGLKTLTVIDETLKLARKTRNISLEIQDIPRDDSAAFEILRRGDTGGVFQFESPGMRRLARRIGIDKFEDILALIALFRPGPMNMLEDYIARRTGKVKVTYINPRLEPILAETYGILLYQEQVQQAAQMLAGYTLGQGDILRRVMGKKKPEEMEKQRNMFMAGCHTICSLPAKEAAQIFDNIAQFAGYCVCKAHTAGYAGVAYQTAYLKAHYPEEFRRARAAVK